MVRTFARLKLRLLANGFRLGWQQKIGLVLGCIYAVPTAFGGFALLAWLRSDADLARPAMVVAFSALMAVWLVAPLVGYGSDETLDPARLGLFPLTRRQLATGLAAASSIGIGASATAVVLAGAVVALAPAGPGIVVVVAAVVTQFALCIVGSRALTTALSGALRSRRGRDVTVLGGVLIAVVVPQSANLFGHDLGRDTLDSAASFLRWTPPGLAARAATTASSGSLVVAVVALAGAVAVVALLGWWWMASLDRSLTTAGPSIGGRAARRAPGLFPKAWAWLPRDHRGAVAAKELRYYGRDPRQRAGTLVFVLFAVAAPVAVSFGAFGGRRPEVVLLACAFAALGGMSTGNQFAYEVGAHWMNVAAASDVRADLLGKNLACGTWIMTAVSAVAVGLAAVGGGWVWVPVAVLIAAAMVGISLGVGNVISVRAPQPMPASSTNLFAANTGQGCSTALVQVVALLVQGALMVPLAAMVIPALVWWRVGLVVVLPLGLAWGYLCWRVGLGWATRWLAPRQSEFLDALSIRRAG